jgi:hypothetical protein
VLGGLTWNHVEQQGNNVGHGPDKLMPSLKRSLLQHNPGWCTDVLTLLTTCCLLCE